MMRNALMLQTFSINGNREKEEDEVEVEAMKWSE
jgi:hypothetical protein